MYILDLNMCNNSGILTTFMIIGYVITITKIVVPFLLMFKCIKQIAPEIIGGDSIAKHIAPIAKSLIAALIVFFIPSILNALFTMMSPDYSSDSYASCVSNANLQKIKQLRASEASTDEGSQVIEFEQPHYKPSGSQSGTGSGGDSSERSGIWVNSIFPLPDGATSCRSSLFGPRTNPITGASENHSGDDYPAACGTSVYAVLDGTVTDMANDNGYHGGRGNYVVIKHSDGKSSVYMHSSNVLVKVGQQVKAGQEIMKVGTTGQSTGCHLHITIKDTNGTNLAPINHIPTLGSCY